MVKKKSSNKHIIIGLLLVAVASAGVYGYFKYNELYPSTDDAYVGANLVNVAPKISGYLQQVNVINNQLVHKGDTLFKLNPVDYNFTLDQAQKNYDSYVSQLDMAKQQLGVQQGSIAKDQEQLKLAKEIASRYKELYAANTLSKQSYDNALTNQKTLQTQMDIDKKKIDQIQSAVGFVQAKMDSAKSTLDSAKSNVDYTEYHSPIDGYITNLSSLSSGEFISVGQQMFGIVDKNSWWVDANFKETQLSRIKAGQSVEIELDTYHHTYHGKVQSVSYASGNTFSLLPAQNATGNWVKVTQRFTVRVTIEDDPKYPLRVGSSAKVKVKTTI